MKNKPETSGPNICADGVTPLRQREAWTAPQVAPLLLRDTSVKGTTTPDYTSTGSSFGQNS